MHSVRNDPKTKPILGSEHAQSPLRALLVIGDIGCGLQGGSRALALLAVRFFGPPRTFSQVHNMSEVPVISSAGDVLAR